MPKDLLKLVAENFQKGAQVASLWGFLLIVLVISIISPPLQSPDEPAHLLRAYALGQGHMVFDVGPHGASGAEVDVGLNQYFQIYWKIVENKAVRLSPDRVEEAHHLRWAGQTMRLDIPGAGYYFPAIYTPQALGLKIGEIRGDTIHRSYVLAKVMNMGAIALTLLVAALLTPSSPLVWGLLLLPMSTYQSAFSTIDGLAHALVVLALAAFVRAWRCELPSARLLGLMCVAIAVVASARLHAAPLVALPFFLFFKSHHRNALLCGLALTAFVIGWTLFAGATIKGVTRNTEISSLGIAFYYLASPLQAFQLLVNTIESYGRFYWGGFLGNLGWLDAPISGAAQVVLFWMLSALAVLGLVERALVRHRFPWFWLLILACCSIGIIFAVQLLTWTIHPARVIDGVQGRYFLVPALIFAFAVQGLSERRANWASLAAFMVMGLLACFSLWVTVDTLLKRFYPNRASLQESVRLVNGDLRPSTMLDREQAYRFGFPLRGVELGRFDRIGVMFGTYMKKNPGQARLMLRDTGGNEIFIDFDLDSLEDLR